MKKNKKKRKTIIFSITTILLLVMVYVSLHLERRVNFLENGVKSITSVLSSAVMIPFKAFNSEKNVDQSESYTIQKNINKSLESEIAELKDTLSLNKTFTEYECINATVLTRNKNYWLNTIIIDKGLDNNIGMDMAVITKNGLIGKIVKVYKNSSEVKLITADDINYKVSVLLSTESGDYYGVLSGYSKNSKLLKIKGVDKDSNIKVGDKATTSGIGGIFPKGVYIGKVEKIKEDKYNLSKVVYIKINQDFNNMIMLIKKAQEMAAEAVQALPPMLNATADKIDAYVAANPSISGK